MAAYYQDEPPAPSNSHNQGNLQDSHDLQRITHWQIIMRHLDIFDLIKLKSVCNSWKDLSSDSSVTLWVLQARLDDAISFIEDIRLAISEPYSDPIRDQEILDFLKNTLDMIERYHAIVQLQLEAYSSNFSFLVLFSVLVLQLKESCNYFELAHFKQEGLTNQADLHESALRRYISQLQELYPFPASGPVQFISPSLLIKDPSARQVWLKMSKGQDLPYLSLSFVTRELSKHIIGQKDSFLPSLNFVLNFPHDSIITTYKWNVFTSMFGPWDHLLVNFDKFVLGTGFVGFENRIVAERILKTQPPKTVLLRASRTNPTLVAVSFNSSSGGMTHVTNNSSWWTKKGFSHFLDDILLKAFAHLSEAARTTAIQKLKKDAVPIQYFVQMFLDSGYHVLEAKIDLNASPVTMPAYFPHISPEQFSSPYYLEEDYTIREHKNSNHQTHITAQSTQIKEEPIINQIPNNQQNHSSKSTHTKENSITNYSDHHQNHTNNSENPSQIQGSTLDLPTRSHIIAYEEDLPEIPLESEIGKAERQYPSQTNNQVEQDHTPATIPTIVTQPESPNLNKVATNKSPLRSNHRKNSRGSDTDSFDPYDVEDPKPKKTNGHHRHNRLSIDKKRSDSDISNHRLSSEFAQVSAGSNLGYLDEASESPTERQIREASPNTKHRLISSHSQLSQSLGASGFSASSSSILHPSLSSLVMSGSSDDEEILGIDRPKYSSRDYEEGETSGTRGHISPVLLSPQEREEVMLVLRAEVLGEDAQSNKFKSPRDFTDPDEERRKLISDVLNKNHTNLLDEGAVLAQVQAFEDFKTTTPPSRSTSPDPLLSPRINHPSTSSNPPALDSSESLEEQLKQMNTQLLDPKGSRFFPFSLLKTKPKQLDQSRLEKYLSENDFSSVFGISRQQFNALPYVAQKQKKKELGLM